MKRRQFLGRAGAATTAVTTVPSIVSADDEVEFTQVGVNNFDADGDEELNIFFEPARGRVEGRAGVRNLNSGGVPAGDYLTSVRLIPPTEMSEFTGNNPTELAYDYLDTEANEAATPDEVWVLVEVSGEHRSFYRASNDNDEGGPVGEWLTREIHREFVGDPEYNAGFNWFEIEADNGVTRVSESLVETVGEDATLLRVGTGGSNFGGDVLTDFYIDKLTLDGNPVGNLPAE